VLDGTGLTVSLGGGTNRLVAKLAAERAKPRPGTGGTGVLVVPPGAEADFLATHRLAELPGVGPRLQATLERYGLRTVREALGVDQPTLASWLGSRGAGWLCRRLRGQGGSTVEPRGEAKSMSREETFPHDLSADTEIETELLRLVTRLAAELRAAGLRARCLTIKLRDHDFRTRQASRTLVDAIDSDRAAHLVARELLRALRAKRRVPARLLGVGFSRFESGPVGGQLALVEVGATAPAETPRDRAVARAVDRVNTRFGRRMLEPARLKRPADPDR
jgi:DNA polymerase-4